MSRETYYTHQDIENLLNTIYTKPRDKKNRRLLDILPVKVIENTIKRHPEDTFYWNSEGLLHTRSRKSYSNPLA